MGLMDSIKGALGGERDEEPTSTDVPETPATPRHIDRDAPAEAPEEAWQVTGGKHRA